MSDENHIGARTTVENALRKDKERLEKAIESISDAFVLYDSDGKLVLFNQKHLDFYPHLADIYRPGVSRKEIMRHHAAAVHENDPEFGEESYLEQRLAAIDEPRPDTESRLPDGRWIAVRERPVPGGGMVSIRTDITERKRIEQALHDSEEQLRAIFNYVPAAFFLKDAEGRYKFVNSRYADWFGVDPGAVKGKSVYDMFPAERAERYHAGDRRVAETNSTVTEEVEIPLPSGQTRTLVLTKFPILNNGKLTDIGGVMIDVTQRKTAENALREKAAILEAAMKTIPDGLQVLDRDLNLVAWNDQLFTILGFDKQEILGSDNPGKAFRYALADCGAYGEGNRDELVASREEFVRSRADVQFERELGNGRWVEYRGLPINVDEGWVAVFRDVSQRRKLEKMKNEFVTTVSHELRTPLTSIYGSLGLVRGGAAGNLPQKAQQFIDIAYKNCTRLVELVNDILDIEKMEAGKLDFTMAPVSVRELIGDTMEANAAYAAQFGVTFEVLKEIPNLTVSADYQRLLQVMANLLSNAAKYSPGGGRVAISAEQTGGIATIAVRDWGNGIPQEYHDVIFEKFLQISSPANLSAPGTGLGLNICQSIINRHDGEIGFVSKPGEGSTFYFKLPAI